jgi:hypothetical protein
LNDSIYDFQTVRLDSVPDFDVFFPRYGHSSAPPATYQQFCSDWFAQLVVNRFIKQDLPPALQTLLPTIGGTYPDASSPSGTASWTGIDLVTDFYRLRFAAQLALADIPQARLRAYEEFFSRSEELGAESEISVFSESAIADFAKVFRCMLDGLPSDHFRVNIHTGNLVVSHK